MSILMQSIELSLFSVMRASVVIMTRRMLRPL